MTSIYPSPVQPGKEPTALFSSGPARRLPRARLVTPVVNGPKYEAPCAEHPETPQTLPTNAIHANHVEALNASLRRRNSAYRRKTNTYAKKKTGLQRTLDVFWIVHNFIRKHFTTQQVPAVALGILEKGLSWGQILRIQRQPVFGI